MQQVGVTRLAVTALPNVTWLTGFDGSTACALVEPERVVLVTDRRYAEVAAALTADGVLDVVTVEQTYDETLVELLAAGSAPVGVEAGHLTVQRQRWLTAVLAARGRSGDWLVPTMDIIEAGRLVKDAWEIERLREAGRRISAVAVGVLADLAPGQREQDVAQAVEAGLRRSGFTRPAFDTIVASGPRAALPHGRATDRTMAPGDLVVLDFGGVYGGYCVDLTRTIVLGAPTAEAARVYRAVAEAQQAAIEALAPGVALADVDQAARAVLARHGLADRFVHGTGHGLGLEVHEAPRVGPARPATHAPLPGTVVLPDVLAAGMVVTIEPGAYIPGWGGVRIEDDLLVTATGAERLTRVPIMLSVD
jgi:Xaa-Pro aminopeptidase